MSPGRYRVSVGVLLGAAAVFLAPTGCDRARRKSATQAPLPRGADPGLRKGGTPGGDPRILNETRPYMGTLFRITVALRGDTKTEAGRQALATSRRNAVEAVRQAFQEVVRVERLFSPYIAGTPVSRINKAAAKAPTKWVKVPQEVFNLIHRSVMLNRRSGGAFDITFGALAEVWKPKNGKPHVPSPAVIRQALQKVGSRYLELDYDKTRVRLSRPGMEIGLGAIAKGYAVDQVVQILRANKLRDFIVDGGGDLYLSGKHPDRPWRVGIKDPRKPREHFASFEVKDRAVVTSGDYERFFMIGGKRYHHILDPRTGYPAKGLMSVTVVAPKATLADALATATFVLGPKKGFDFLRRFADTECILVTTEGRVIISAGLRDKVKKRDVTKGP